MAELLASRLKQTLADLVVKEDAAKEKIEREVNTLVSVLTWIEGMWNGGNIMEVAKNVKDIMCFTYMIEDTLEGWAVKVEAASMGKIGTKSILERCFGGHHDSAAWEEESSAIIHMVDLLGSADDFAQLLSSSAEERYEELWRQIDAAATLLGRLISQKYDSEEHFVRMKDLENLKHLVKERRLVSICGVKGMGKTSLARKLYNSPEVISHFQAFAWVSFSQHHDNSSLLQKIRNQLVAEEQKKGSGDSQIKQKRDSNTKGGMSENKTGPSAEAATKSDDQQQQLISELKEIQGRKNCFVVINDISKTSQWTDISSAFDLQNTRILLTVPDRTTISDVVSHEETEADKVFYELKELDKEEGWMLLKNHAFCGERVPEKGIAPKLGKKMLEKCEGLPLKISGLGRILSKMPSSEWHKVNENVNGYLQMDDDQTQSNEKPNEVSFKIYDQLNYHQKQRFLFLASFKGNEVVDSEDLKLLWMAEGMVSPHHLPTMDEVKQQQSTTETTELQQATLDIAEEYVQFFVDHLPDNGRFKPLHLRDKERKLSLHYGKREEFRLKVLDFSGGQQHMLCVLFLDRRLAIHFNKLSSSLEKYALYGTRNLRSLFFLNSDQEYTVLPVKISDFKEFELLRVLHFVRCKFDRRKLPQGIDELFNLRYLGVLYCDLDELPESLRNVRNLHILNVRAYHDAKITIPDAIYEMARLKHLRLPHNLVDEQSTMPRNQGNSVHKESNKLKVEGLHDLESLDGFNADIHDVESLSKLEKLRHLIAHANSNDSLESIIKFVEVHGARVRTNLYVESKCNFTSVEGLEILEEVLMCPNLHSLTLVMVRVDVFPNCGTLASKELTEIKLIGCKLNEDPMGALGNFPKLQKLCFGYGAFVGTEMTIDDKGFSELEYLELSHLPNLEEWKAAEGAMKRLLAMKVECCPNLKKSTFDSSRNNLQMVSDENDRCYLNNDRCYFKKSHTREFDPSSSGSSAAH